MIGRIEDLFAKFFQLFNTDCSNRLAHGLAAFFRDGFEVFEIIKWHMFSFGSLGYSRLIVLLLKMIDHISDRREAIYAAQFAVDAFMAEAIAH